MRNDPSGENKSDFFWLGGSSERTSGQARKLNRAKIVKSRHGSTKKKKGKRPAYGEGYSMEQARLLVQQVKNS
jgi:hypothetical protein